MTRDAKRMKPTRGWAIVGKMHRPVTDSGGEWEPMEVFAQKRAAAARVWKADERVIGVLITELPPKRKRHAT